MFCLHFLSSWCGVSSVRYMCMVTVQLFIVKIKIWCIELNFVLWYVLIGQHFAIRNYNIRLSLETTYPDIMYPYTHECFQG